MTTKQENQANVATERDALTTLIARFSADRDSLATLVQECEARLGDLASRVESGAGGNVEPMADAAALQRLAEVETAARSGQDELATLREGLGEVRETVASLREALERKAVPSEGSDPPAGVLHALEARIESLGLDLTRAITVVERRLAERGAALAREIEELRSGLRAAGDEEARRIDARLAEIETAARSGREEPGAFREELVQVRKAVTSLHEALELKADRSEGGEALAGIARSLETRVDSLGNDLTREIEELRSGLRAGSDEACRINARLAEIETAARSGRDEPGGLREGLGQVREAVASLREALERKADRSEGSEALAGIARSLETRVESLSMDLWRSISSVDRRLAERGATHVQDIEQLRCELRAGIDDQARRTNEWLAEQTAKALGDVERRLDEAGAQLDQRVDSAVTDLDTRLEAELQRLRGDVEHIGGRLSAVAEIQDAVRRRLEEGALTGLATWLRDGAIAADTAAIGMVARVVASGLVRPRPHETAG
jgi:chromosome segregation ATPase